MFYFTADLKLIIFNKLINIQNILCLLVKSMNFPVHGGYGSWSDFSSCSKSCSGGVSRRVRQCDNPKPQFGGKSCKERELGPDEETKMCNTHPCPGIFVCLSLLLKCVDSQDTE